VSLALARARWRALPRRALFVAGTGRAGLPSRSRVRAAARPRWALRAAGVAARRSPARAFGAVAPVRWPARARAVAGAAGRAAPGSVSRRALPRAHSSLPWARGFFRPRPAVLGGLGRNKKPVEIRFLFLIFDKKA
jgi:hypothetical protein